MISYIIPTRNRHQRLAQTLDALHDLYSDHPPLRRAAEVIIIDNASDTPVEPPPKRPHGLTTRLIRLDDNLSAGARNVGAREARHDWLVMLDDDSHPLDVNIHRLTSAAPPAVGAIGAEILLPDGSHEAGGLPEVFIGCAAAIRRDLFNKLGGYDESFHYYAEEYDLAARILLAGSGVIHHAGWRVMHHKVTAGRDMNAILRNLVRNNLWINARYTPDAHLQEREGEIVSRYQRIAQKEHALTGYRAGLAEGEAALTDQRRTPMPPELDDRFTGLAAARAALAEPLARTREAALIHRGKNAWCIERILREMSTDITDAAPTRIIATMSPGPILDARNAEHNNTPIAPYNMPGYERRASPRHAA